MMAGKWIAQIERLVDFSGFVRNQGGQLEVMDELGGMDMDRWFRSTNAIVLKLYQRLVGLDTLDQSDEETWPDQQKTKI